MTCRAQAQPPQKPRTTRTQRITELRRELRVRGQVFPSLIRAGKLTTEIVALYHQGRLLGAAGRTERPLAASR